MKLLMKEMKWNDEKWNGEMILIDITILNENDILTKKEKKNEIIEMTSKCKCQWKWNIRNNQYWKWNDNDKQPAKWREILMKMRFSDEEIDIDDDWLVLFSIVIEILKLVLILKWK